MRALLFFIICMIIVSVFGIIISNIKASKEQKQFKKDVLTGEAKKFNFY